MSQWMGFQFTTPSEDAAEQFVSEYVLDALDRIETYDGCETATFAFGGHPERKMVLLGGFGDTDVLLEQEREHWEQYVNDGLIEEWEEAFVMDESEMRAMMGDQAADLRSELSALSAQMAREAYQTFEKLEDRPAAVNTYPDEESEGGPIGWWSVLHTVTVQLNYDLDEELDAYVYGIEHTLRNAAEYEGEDAVDERIDELEQELARMREEVKDGRLVSL